MASVSAGDVVAEKYRVERLLGRGGMGYVVAARHLTLDQLVAIKFLRKSALSDEEALARFRREAKACVRLKNEHVAKVFDVGVHGEEPFIVMEHLEGDDLGAITKEGQPLPIGDACDYILQACEALAEAHSLGIVHRDIKLPNLFLCSSGPAAGQGLLKVLDFGVSKVVAGEHESMDVTQTAAVLGSPKYMSPEQMNDPRGVDWRTDIWSLGICLYRLISGHAPFDGDTIGRLCTMVLHELPTPLSTLRPDVSPALEAVITCTLQKDRNFRFSNVAELAAALIPFASEPERATESARHVATVLGVTAKPPGYLPPQPPTPLFQQLTTGPLEGAAAWAHTMVQQKEKRQSERTFALTAGALLLGLTIVCIAVLIRGQGHGQGHPTAAATQPPSTPTQIATPVPVPVPVPIVVTTAPAIATTTAPAATTATAAATTTVAVQPTAPATTTRRPGGGQHARPGRPTTAPDEARPSNDGSPLPIPGDRK